MPANLSTVFCVDRVGNIYIYIAWSNAFVAPLIIINAYAVFLVVNVVWPSVYPRYYHVLIDKKKGEIK